MRNLLADLHVERAKYGDVPTREELGKLLNAVAWKNRDDGWGLSGKSFGTNVPMPNGTLIAHDILHHKPTNLIVDCLEGAGKAAKPVWPPPTLMTLEDRPWVAPVDPDNPHGNPDPNPGGGGDTIDALDLLVADVGRLAAGLEGIAEFVRSVDAGQLERLATVATGMRDALEQLNHRIDVVSRDGLRMRIR